MRKRHNTPSYHDSKIRKKYKIENDVVGKETKKENKTVVKAENTTQMEHVENKVETITTEEEHKEKRAEVLEALHDNENLVRQ